MPQIEQAYIKTGRVRYVVRDFPLESIHADAFKAAEAAHCAGDGGAFWPMHHRLFAHQTELTREELPGHAQAVGIDVAAFRQCLESGKYTVRVHRDLADGIRASVNSTPSFFIGCRRPISACAWSAWCAGPSRSPRSRRSSTASSAARRHDVS